MIANTAEWESKQSKANVDEGIGAIDSQSGHLLCATDLPANVGQRRTQGLPNRTVRSVPLRALTTLGTLHDIAGMRARGDGQPAWRHVKAIVRLWEACNAMRAHKGDRPARGPKPSRVSAHATGRKRQGGSLRGDARRISQCLGVYSPIKSGWYPPSLSYSFSA